MNTPCKDCPFRTDVKPYLRAARVSELEGSLAHRGRDFTCHKTLVVDEDEDGGDEDGEGSLVPGPNAQRCAGAAILLHKIGRENQMMRLEERLGLLDLSALDMDAPVFDSFLEMKQAQSDYVEPEPARNPCAVSDSDCRAPAGRMGDGGVEEGTKDAEYECNFCGDPVCGSCSKMRKGRRMCAVCLEDEEDRREAAEEGRGGEALSSWEGHPE